MSQASKTFYAGQPGSQAVLAELEAQTRPAYRGDEYPGGPFRSDQRPKLQFLLPLLIPLVALFIVAPLQIRGVSCGDDFPFHVESWVDAAQQIRHGVLWPHWTVSAAYNAGEPRFVFYPPLSWMLGALIALIWPSAHLTVIFIFICLTSAGFSMLLLARRYTTLPGAVLCACLYAVDPYLVLDAMERSAFGELVAAIWVPLLLLGALRQRLEARWIALPLCLIWLSNVPTGIGATYLLAFLLTVRLVFVLKRDAWRPGTVFASEVINGIGGIVLAFLLGAFFILPAAYEKKYIQVAKLFVRGSSVQENFLFHHTGSIGHDQTLQHASYLGVLFVLVTAFALCFGNRKSGEAILRMTWYALGCSSVLLFFALTPLSAPFWSLPELALMQFPWRLLTLSSAIAILSIALCLRDHRRLPLYLGLAVPALALFVAVPSLKAYRRACIVPQFDRFLSTAIKGGHGMRPTPEDAPDGVSDTTLHINNPGYWLADNADQAYPNTFVSPDPLLDPNYTPGVPSSLSLSQPAPQLIQVNLEKPKVLVLNLRDFPSWQVTRNGSPQPILKRVDGLIAMPLPSGASTIIVTWKRPVDQVVGDVISICAMILLLGLQARSALGGGPRRHRDSKSSLSTS